MKYFIGRSERNLLRPICPTTKSVLIREVALSMWLREQASAFRAHGVLYQHFDREKMGDHVTAVVPVMIVWLDGPVGIFGAREQGVAPRLFWRQPIKFPTPPCMPSRRIEKMRFGPGLAAVSAHSDLRYLSLACPCGAEDGVGLVRQE